MQILIATPCRGTMALVHAANTVSPPRTGGLFDLAIDAARNAFSTVTNAPSVALQSAATQAARGPLAEANRLAAARLADADRMATAQRQAALGDVSRLASTQLAEANRIATEQRQAALGDVSRLAASQLTEANRILTAQREAAFVDANRLAEQQQERLQARIDAEEGKFKKIAVWGAALVAVSIFFGALFSGPDEPKYVLVPGARL